MQPSQLETSAKVASHMFDLSDRRLSPINQCRLQPPRAQTGPVLHFAYFDMVVANAFENKERNLL